DNAPQSATQLRLIACHKTNASPWPPAYEDSSNCDDLPSPAKPHRASRHDQTPADLRRYARSPAKIRPSPAFPDLHPRSQARADPTLLPENNAAIDNQISAPESPLA